MPQIIFWNLRATEKSFPVTKSQAGTALVSGFSAQLMKVFMEAQDFDPVMILNMTLDKYDITEVPTAEKYPIPTDGTWTGSFAEVDKVVEEFLVPKTRKQKGRKMREEGQGDAGDSHESHDSMSDEEEEE